MPYSVHTFTQHMTHLLDCEQMWACAKQTQKTWYDQRAKQHGFLFFLPTSCQIL